MGASALFLAACATSGPTKPKTAEDLSDSQKSLRFDGKATYRNSVGEDFPLLDTFVTSTGIAVTYTNLVSEDNVYYSKVKKQLALGNDIGADASVLSDWMAARWIRMGYVQALDLSNIPNVAEIRFRFAKSAGDPSRGLALPWRSGFTGIAWNRSVLPEGLSSVSDLWSSHLAGRVGVMSSLRETLGMIMMDAGVDISGSEWGDAEFTAAVETLRSNVSSAQVRNIKGSKYLEDLKSGETVAAIARAGDIIQLNEEAGDQWEFTIPEAGGVMWSDVVVVPTGSSHRKNVEEFMNFYYEPAHAVEVSAATHFISPIDIRELAAEIIDPDVASNRMVFPTPVTFERVKPFRALKQDEEQRYRAQYQTILLAGN